MEYDEMLSSANMGLWRSIENYDPKKSVPFAKFAMRRCIGFVLDDFRDRQGYRKAHKLFFIDPDVLKATTPKKANTIEWIPDFVTAPQVHGKSIDTMLMEELLDRLPPKLEEVLRRHYLEQERYEEIAAEEGITDARLFQRRREALRHIYWRLVRNDLIPRAMSFRTFIERANRACRKSHPHRGAGSGDDGR